MMIMTPGITTTIITMTTRTITRIPPDTIEATKMKKNEWHIHFNENMTRLSKAQEQLKVAAPDSIEFHDANKEVRARTRELDCLNSANTLIEPPDEVMVKTKVAHATSIAPGRKPLIALPDLAPHAGDLRPGFRAARG